jgi:hypothetical protein
MERGMVDSESGLHIVFNGGGGGCLAPSFIEALGKTHEMSARARTLAEAPMSIWQAATDRRWDAHEIVAEWDARGWPRPCKASP